MYPLFFVFFVIVLALDFTADFTQTQSSKALLQSRCLSIAEYLIV